MTAIWMGLDTVRNAQGAGRIFLTGDRKLAENMQAWLGLSPFAGERKRTGDGHAGVPAAANPTALLVAIKPDAAKH